MLVLERKQFLDAPPNECCCATRLVTVQTTSTRLTNLLDVSSRDAFPHFFWGGDARARRPQLLWPPAYAHAPIPPHPTPVMKKEAALSVKHATQFPSIISAFLGGAAESAFDLSHSLLARGVAGHYELSMRIAAGNRRPIGRFKDTVLRPPA